MLCRLGKFSHMLHCSDVIFAPNSPSTIFFTSGTLGESKAVLLSHGNIASVINSYLEIFELSDVALSILPFHQAFGLVCGVVIISSSTNTVFINTQSKNLLNNMKDSSANLICVVPAYLEFFQKRIENSIRFNKSMKRFQLGRKICRLCSTFGIDLHRIIFKAIYTQLGNDLQTLITGGAPVRDATVQFFRDIGLNVFNRYGLTETSSVVAVEYLNAIRIKSCGKPLSCCTVRIADDGEIFIKGDNIFLGYYKDEALTQKAITNGEFATGVLGYVDEDCFLFVTGRKKNLIILSNGENVSPEEIEMQLFKDEGIEEVIVVEHENRIVALVFPSEEYKGDVEYFRQLRDRYNRQVSSMLQIADIRLRETALEKNTSRKILRDGVKV
jgi:long-chain acyl-CoA synthetase